MWTQSGHSTTQFHALFSMITDNKTNICREKTNALQTKTDSFLPVLAFK